MAAAAAAAAGGVAAGVAGSPCGACKFLRRRCVAECVFAPYFSSDQGAARFAAIHKVFGASNAAKLLAHLPLADRCEAVVTITYEAQSRLRDPVAILQAQLMQARAQIACGVQSTTSPVSHQWPDSTSSSIASLLRQQEVNSGSFATGGALLPELMGGDVSMLQQHCGGKVEGGGGGAGDLQYLAQAMMRSSNYSL
uniref:Uncharacterized protein n=1 Tax=Aegilops tauschii TaxID=37682 RepID=M8AWQ8_AEGTA